MAKDTRNADDRSASPGNDVPNSFHTRRAVLGAFVAAAGAAGSIGTAVASAGRVEGTNMNMHAAIALPINIEGDRWSARCREFGKARAAVERYEVEQYKPATAHLNALTGPCPPTKIDLVAKSGAVATYTVWQSDWYEGMRWFEPVREARRQYDEHFQRVGRLEHETGWSGISDEMARLDTTEGEARDRLMAEPSPDATALAYKLKLALEGEEMRDDDRAILVSEAHRFAIK